MTDDFIYLDHNSTSPIDPSVAKTMSDYLEAGYVNPASQHRMGQLARRELEKLRRQIAEMLGANCRGMQTDQLLFTSGGTESNNLALLGLATATNDSTPTKPDGFRGRVLVSAVEHPSIIGAAQELARMGFEVEKIPVDKNGVLKLDDLRSLMETKTDLVSVMLVNNETGVIQPVAEAAKICQPKGVLFHCDATQAIGKIPVNFAQLGIDAMSFTGHKLGGPRGIGGLLVRHGIVPSPLLFGGFQQMGIRPGTEDVALVAGLNRSIELYHDQPQQRSNYLLKLRDRFESALAAEFNDLHINGGHADRAPHTSNLSFAGIDRQTFLLAADMAGLAISTGSACASGSSELSPVLLAMGVDDDVAAGSIRVSFGNSTTVSQVDDAIDRIGQIVRNFRGLK